jgi:hypothetical protein
VIFPYVLTIYFGGIHFHHHSPLPPSLLLKMISTDFIVQFSYKYITYISIITLLHPLHSPLPPTNTHPLRGSCFTFLSFNIYVHVHCSEGFALLFHLCIYCILIVPAPSLLSCTLSLSLLLFNSFQCILLCLLSTQTQCILFCFVLFSCSTGI